MADKKPHCNTGNHNPCNEWYDSRLVHNLHNYATSVNVNTPSLDYVDHTDVLHSR